MGSGGAFVVSGSVTPGMEGMTGGVLSTLSGSARFTPPMSGIVKPSGELEEPEVEVLSSSPGRPRP